MFRWQTFVIRDWGLVIFKFAPSASLLSGLARRRNDCAKLVGLSHQLPQTAGFDQRRLGQEFEPVNSLISFFFDYCPFGCKVGTRACSASGSVVGADGSARPEELPAHDLNGRVTRERRDQFDHA
jgi:hypothetical protein